MSFPYKNPISPNQLLGQQSLERTKTYGTSYSTLSTGGYMEVYSLDQLYYTIPSLTYGPIEYSGNSIPITFSKGSGTTFSLDTLTLHPDNISSGRRKLGMLVYVYEENQIYQFLIDNYDTLWNAATGSTGTTIISDFGTTIKANSSENIAFISGWTANTIAGISGETNSTAVWKIYSSPVSFTGNTSATCITDLYVENLYGCSPINVNDLLIGNSGFTSDNVTGLTIVNNYIETTGNTVVIDLVGSKLNDSSGNQSINLTTRLQYDSVGTTSIDWENKSLNDSTGIGSVLWDSKGLFDSAGLTSQLWNDRRLYDANEIQSLNYDNRSLQNSSSVDVLNWETGTITDFTNIVSTSISATTYLNLPSSPGGTFTGGTVTGPTDFISGLTANTISATTYENLPQDIFVSGGTYDNGTGTATFTNTSGGTFSVSGFSTGGGSSTNFKYVKSNSQSFLEANLAIPIRTFLLNEIIFYPVFIRQSLDITHAQLQVTSTAGASSRVIVGIYDNATDGLPTNLLTSVIINTTSNSVFSTAFSSPLSVTPGTYWIGVNTNISYACYCLRSGTLGNLQNNIITVISNSNGGGLSNYERYRLSYTYDGTLPNPVASPLTLTPSDYANPFITFLIDY